MNIFLGNTDPISMQKIDELAKENEVSRQQFLREQFEILAFLDEQTGGEKRLEDIIE
ncbi:hypothetical protein [Priestia aryabhattai]|uniref:hypothetical protein n=1 Tax=Priestia aryabhattai TaxID=412384 RepID=UPI001FB284EE|nr:hypothetical protein [Priestia aryabhattai]